MEGYTFSRTDHTVSTGPIDIKQQGAILLGGKGKPGGILAPSVTEANTKAVADLQKGVFPGKPIGAPHTPREMPKTVNPNATANDFATKVLGRQPTADELARGSRITVDGKPCNGCWVASPDGNKTVITYRPAGVASTVTDAKTASVDINYKSTNNVANDGRPLKLKFPEL